MKLEKEECRDKILELAKQTECSVSIELLKEHELYYEMLKYWKNLTEFKNEFGLLKKQTFDGKTYSRDELINILQKFCNETGIIPTSLFMDKHNKEYGLPSRKTFVNKIGAKSWKDVLLTCGIDANKAKIHSMKEKPQHDDKDFLINLVHEYIDKYGIVPTLENLETYYGTSLSKYFGDYFGGWNNCLKELGLSLNSVQKYKDEELDNAFLGFVEEFGRVPSIRDFNNTGRPSFWCYQNRYGSYAETCSRILGIPFYFHSMRHNLVSRLSKYNIPSNIIVEFVGWSKEGGSAMIGIYDDNEAVDDFGKYFNADGIVVQEEKSFSDLK